MNFSPQLTILGGGPAGLAAAFYARKAGLPFVLYEAGREIGGNARTLQWGPFLFDTGAHRFHDKNPEVTRDIKGLLGSDLRRVDAPSQIFYGGKFIDFPLSPLNLLMNLGFLTCLRAGLEILTARFRKKPPQSHFRDFALATYGRTLAEAFLLGYSEKLWGRPASELSSRVSGKRMKGLTVNTLIKELFRGRRAKTEHLDGAFYYPRRGIGMIAERIAEFSGLENIRKGSRVTRIFHQGSRIEAIEINGEAEAEVEEVVSSLPLSLLLEILDPAPPREILALGRDLSFRNLILVAVFLKRERVSPNASVYFPSRDFIFTRVYESKNRSLEMAPPGQTSLVVEIPCSEKDEIWIEDDRALGERVTGLLARTGWFRQEEVLGTSVERIRYAYPVLEAGIEEKISEIADYLASFENLHLSGRSGEFAYTHIHDLLQNGRQIVESLRTSFAPALV